MRRETVRLQQNLAAWLGGASLEEMYVLARGLRVELCGRGLGAEIEAASVECALLAEVLHVQQAIYSEDCADEPRWYYDPAEWFPPVGPVEAPPRIES